MGKKVVNHNLAASTTRTSKNVDKQLHSVINVLRPKVYIIHSSGFKHLVQELTGYRTQTVPNPDDVMNAVVPVVEVEERGEMLFPDFTTTLSTDPSLDCSVELFDDDQVFRFDDMNRITGLLQTDDRGLLDEMYDSSMNYRRKDDWLACQNLESWLLDAEPCYDSTRHEQEDQVSLFDYDQFLAGLI